MKKIMIFTLALVIVLSAFVLSQYDSITDVYANNDKCEDNKTCYWAHHVDKPHQKEQCRHNENSQWKFNQPLEECGNDKPEKLTTDTPDIPDSPPIVELPTATKQKDNQIHPTNTPSPEKKDDPVPTQGNDDSSDSDRNNPTPTLTPTYVTGEDPAMICNWCSIAERDVAAQETQAAAQATIAAELTGGD